jgi:NAD dependent epimerase/dehydratase family enzyme
VIGKSAESVLASQRVIPKKLLENGFKFKYENIKGALSDLLKK